MTKQARSNSATRNRRRRRKPELQSLEDSNSGKIASSSIEGPNKGVQEARQQHIGLAPLPQNMSKAALPKEAVSSEEILHMVVSNAPIILFALDQHGIFTLSEGRGLQSLGLSPGEVVGTSVFELYPDIPETIDHIRHALNGEELRAIDRIGDKVFETQFMPLYDAGGQVCGVIGIATDISKRVRAEEALQASEKRFRTMIEQATDLIVIIDAGGRYQYVSPSHRRIMGYSPQDLLGKRVYDFIHPADKKRVYSAWAATFQSPDTIVQMECRLRHANGSWVTLEISGRNCLNDPVINGFIINSRDITERAELEEKQRYLAFHDILTGLPNRLALFEKMEQVLSSQEQARSELALLILDLNRFKDINDTLGHYQGDMLLQQVGERLCRLARPGDMVARLGGDEFALLLPRTTGQEAQEIAHKILATLEEPFSIQGHTLQIDASIGAVLYPVHGDEPLTLLRRADVAMYTAKRIHENYVLYKEEYDQHNTQRLDLIGALRHAVLANEFILYYQPKADIKTGAIHGVEALVRWQHPTRGLVFPDQFIPLAEQTGLIAPLTLWVLETAICQCRDWLRAGIDLEVAVNLSMWDLRDATLPSKIKAMLKEHNVPPDHLRIELTESSIMADPDLTLSVLKQLAALGIQSSIDDFGTGYSSLTYLKRLPVNELKIDRSFVQHITEVEADATIVRSTIMMAHSLGLQVVAEGVENAESFRLLADLDCDTAQGYFLSRPLPVHELERWLQNSRISPLAQLKQF